MTTLSVDIYLKTCGPFPAFERLPCGSFGRVSRQISDHLTWAGANAARIAGVKHACHVTWPLFMLEQCGFLPVRSLWGMISATTRTLRSCRLAPAFLKAPGPPGVMLDRVRRQCLGVEEGGGGLVLVTSFGIEPPRSLPPCLKVIGRGHLPETIEELEEHPELKVRCDTGAGSRARGLCLWKMFRMSGYPAQRGIAYYFTPGHNVPEHPLLSTDPTYHTSSSSPAPRSTSFAVCCFLTPSVPLLEDFSRHK